jgi:hypothetical protein
MQTFLPYPDFVKSAQCLDYRRLGKQRVEAYQILNILTGDTQKKGWRNHPAVRMWRGYETALCVYAIAMCNEWKARGYKDTLTERFVSRLEQLTGGKAEAYELPPWFTDDDFHTSHQSNLLRKSAQHYGKYFNVKDDLPYVWPV